MKTFAIFLLSKENFMIRTCSVLASFFRKLLSKASFERKLSTVSLAFDRVQICTFEGAILRAKSGRPRTCPDTPGCPYVLKLLCMVQHWCGVDAD